MKFESAIKVYDFFFVFLYVYFNAIHHHLFEARYQNNKFLFNEIGIYDPECYLVFKQKFESTMKVSDFPKD